MDTLVNNAHSDKDKTHPTKSNVLLLQHVPPETKFSESEMLKTATDAEHALFHSSQDKIDLNAIDQDQIADVPNNTQLMDTAVSHAQQDKFLMISDKPVTQPKNAMDLEKFLVPLKTAIDADNAHLTLFQTLTEEHVLDKDQLVDVLKDTQLTDTIASNAQLDKLLIQITTRDVFHNNATRETKSSLPKNSAGNVKLAHKDINQTQPELSASESSQLAVVPKFMTKVDMSASHAHHIKLPPTVTKDVSQDNAQDSMKSLVLLISAMLVNNAKRDLPQIT